MFFVNLMRAKPRCTASYIIVYFITKVYSFSDDSGGPITSAIGNAITDEMISEAITEALTRVMPEASTDQSAGKLIISPITN